MKHLALALLALALGCKANALPPTVALAPAEGVGQATPPVGTATQITVAWAPSLPTTAWPACSATVSTFCIAGYTGTITSPAGNTVNIPMCSSTVTANCIAAGQAISSYVYSPGGALYYGTWNLTLQVVAWGATSGTAIANCSSSVTTGCAPAPITGTAVYAQSAPVTVVPAPGGLTIQFQ